MNKNELLKLYNLPFKELLEEAKKYTFREFELCSLISARSGKCSQDCKYCAQAARYNVDCPIYPLVDIDEVIKQAKAAKASGANRFAIVTSGKTPDEAKDFEILLDMIKKINEIGLKSCASLGILDEKQACALKNAGLVRYHHNINTNKNYHDKICTTHTYQDRINTARLAKNAGLELCCGVIIGMGESVEDRVDMALELSKIAPESIPVNILSPIKGTPFENYFDKIDEENIIRTIAIFKIANPKSSIRLAGGKKDRISKENLEILFKNCIDSTIMGNYLTTKGYAPDDDKERIKRADKILSLTP